MYNSLMKQSKEKGNEDILLNFINNCCNYVRFKIISSLNKFEKLEELDEKEEFDINYETNLFKEIEIQIHELKMIGYVFPSENIGEICVSIVNEGLKRANN